MVDKPNVPIANIPTPGGVPIKNVPVPGFNSKMTLPPELVKDSNILAVLKLGVTQWSRIAAWSWCDYLAFKGDPKKEPQEKKLKEFLYTGLTEQAKYADGYLYYGDAQSKQTADNWSRAIVYLLLGKNEAAVNLINNEDFTSENMGVTLSDVLQKTTGKPLVTSVPENESFVKLFYVQITRDSFSGKIVRAPEEGVTIDTFTRYINIIAYPPRPVLGPLTVTEEVLVKWASNDDEYLGEYLPPSAYIPIATS